MIIVVPAVMPVTTPDEEPIVATLVLLLLHKTPPGVASDNTVTAPSQIAAAPEMADGKGFTVIEIVL